MASGRVHAQVSMYLSPVVGLSIGLAMQDWRPAVASLAGCAVLGQVLTPDADLIGFGESGSWALCALRWSLGVPISVLFRVYFTPYSKAIPHRSFWSHFPIVGTIGRLIYTIPFWYPLYWLHGWVEPTLAWMAVGLAVSDIGHWIFDFPKLSKRFGNA